MRQLSEPRSGVLYARRFGWLWRGLALLVLLAAASLTLYVVFQDPNIEVIEERVALFGHYHAGDAANVIVQWTPRANSYRNIWYVKYPRGTQLLLLPGTGPCSQTSYYNFAQYQPETPLHIRVVRQQDPFDSYVWVSVAGVESNEIACVVSPRPTRASFTRYEFEVQYHAKAPRRGLQPVPIIYMLPNIERAESLEVRGVPSYGSAAELRFGDTAAVKYANAVKESERDILFVVIGALIALGAAMILESLRPAIEASAERWAMRRAQKAKE